MPRESVNISAKSFYIKMKKN